MQGIEKDSTEQIELIPWEDKKIGFWQSFWLNWVQIIFTPQKFFSRMPKNKEIGSPLLFFIFSFCIYFVIGLFFSFLRPSFKISNFIIDELLIGFPAILAIIFITTYIVYFFTHLFGIKDRWQNVFRIVCYGDAAIILFGIIPFLGILICLIWGIVLVIIGIKNVFKVSVGKAISVFLSSFFTFLIFIIGLTIVLMLVTGLGLYIFKPELISGQFEMNAITNCKRIVKACEKFKNYKGYYPMVLSQLSSEETSYLDYKITKATTPLDKKNGYFFIYTQVDETHYTLFAKPVKRGRFSGQKTFFVNESGIIRLNNATGPPVIEDKRNK